MRTLREPRKSSALAPLHLPLAKSASAVGGPCPYCGGTAATWHRHTERA